METQKIKQTQNLVVIKPLIKSQCPEWLKEEISDMRKQEEREFEREYGDNHNQETNDWVNRGGY